MNKTKPKFCIGELVRVESAASPELNTPCTEVMDSNFITTRSLNGEKSKGWRYRCAHQPFSPRSPKKRLWFREESLRKIDRPKEGAEEWLKRTIPNFNKITEKD